MVFNAFLFSLKGFSETLIQKSNQADDRDNQNNNDNHKTISETKDDRSDKSNPTTAVDKITEKETK